jgi:RimJ/RimL family protein N-acetyltransferase
VETPVIESERLRLDSVTEGDEEAVFTYCQDEELQRWVPVPTPYTRASAALFTGDYARGAANSESLTLWAIRERDVEATGADAAPLLGVIELRFEPFASATVGFWLGREWRGLGYMSEALQTLVEYAFDYRGLRLDRLHWESIVGNIASAVVARRAGFQFEGVSRGSLIHRGTRLDSWQATLLATDPRAPAPGWPL